MNILHLMPYCPVPPIFGGALRIYYLLKTMVDQHSVTVLTYGSEADRRGMLDAFGGRIKAVHMIPHRWIARFRRLGQLYALCTNQSYFGFLTHRREMQELIDRLLSSEEFDIVQSEFPMMASFDFKTDAVKIMDAHNVEYDNFRRMWQNVRSFVRRAHYHREYRAFFLEELEACRKQDALFVTSTRDRDLFDLHHPHLPKYVVPNGVDTEYFRPSEDNSEPSSLVFTGMMGYVPNYDGMLYFLDEIFPLIQREVPDAKIYIVGNRPPQELLRRRSLNVVVTDFVPDVRPYIQRASVYVVPLRMGGGTRLKVVEAMAMKKPIVTTSVGCEGIEVEHGATAYVEDDPRRFAERVVELMRSPLVRRQFVERGYELVRSRYDWRVVGDGMHQLYQQLVSHKKEPRTIVSEKEEQPIVVHGA
ncbi:MAG: glycosyltransferase [Bacteroidota bacterium]